MQLSLLISNCFSNDIPTIYLHSLSLLMQQLYYFFPTLLDVFRSGSTCFPPKLLSSSEVEPITRCSLLEKKKLFKGRFFLQDLEKIPKK